uniref:Uncharacterized protein n=1 Tax=Aegilops tauschii subsp. strangulata TaxID=200361 RepID=A0A453JDB2_AEGTS
YKTTGAGRPATRPAQPKQVHVAYLEANPSCRLPPPAMAAALLTPTQRYAAGALLALALRQAQIHQSVLLGSPLTSAADDEERASSASGGSGSSSSTGGSGEDAEAAAKALWTHDSRGLLRPVFRSGPPPTFHSAVTDSDTNASVSLTAWGLGIAVSQVPG